MAGFRSRRDDHESTERLGGRQAGCAASGGAVLDAWFPERAKGPVCALPALLLDHVEFLKEQGSRQEPLGLPVAIGGRREDGHRQRRLRSAFVREANDLQGLGGRRSAKGNALPLSGSV